MLTTKEDNVPFPYAISEKLRMSQTTTATIDIATHIPKGKRDFSVIFITPIWQNVHASPAARDTACQQMIHSETTSGQRNAKPAAAPTAL
jgi:hypothetical protein